MKRSASRALLSALLAWLVLVSTVGAQEDIYTERTMELARKLQCPICAGQSVADSQVTLARQMRDVIEEKVQAGESDQQILDYFVQRYGEDVLSEPPKSGFHLTLWWVPVVGLLAGAGIVVLYLREMSGRPPADGESDGERDSELEDLAHEALSPDSRPSSP